jgi:hypothetical protein
MSPALICAVVGWVLGAVLAMWELILEARRLPEAQMLGPMRMAVFMLAVCMAWPFFMIVVSIQSAVRRLRRRA